MKEKPVILLGAGGHAKVLLDILLEQNIEVLGIAEKNGTDLPTDLYGVPVIGSDSDVQQYPPDKVELVNGIGSIGSTALRQKVYEKFKRQDYCFAQVIHPGAIISRQVELGEGVQIMAGAVVNIGTRIRENSIINTNASVDHDCDIGAHVHIAPGVTLSGGVTVGDGSHIGTGASVVQGIVIGDYAFVEVGGIVMKNMGHRERLRTYRGQIAQMSSGGGQSTL
ncbi:MAG: acetyltransferase [Schwartzia succinivorans]|nr:acetyltransferase [Schwartzia succinivorans]